MEDTKLHYKRREGGTDRLRGGGIGKMGQAKAWIKLWVHCS